jgi:plasmid stabilization system protein ParE
MKGHEGRKPDWHWKALALHTAKVSMRDIAVQVGKAEPSVAKVLYGAWGKEQRREIQARAYEERMAEAVDPAVKFQAAGSEMADIMLTAARDETQPLKRALIAEKNLALGGWVAVSKSVTLNVEARIRDQAALPDHVLEAFANGGAIPEALRPLLVMPEDAE